MKNFLLPSLLLIITSFIYAQDMQRVRKNIDTLTAPGMHGRGYINNGDKIAANYLAQRFTEAGLQKFEKLSNSSNPYFQHFSFNINTFPNNMSLVVGKTTLNPGEQYILNPSSGSGKKSLKVKYLDTLIFTNLDCRNKFLSSDNSKIALVYNSKYSKQINGLSKETYRQIYTSGAVIELHDKKLTASVATYQLNSPYFEVKGDVFPFTTKKISINVNAELKTQYQSQNVIGYIIGKTQPDSFVVISAHYDHLGRMGKEIYFPGANDNASGISMLLELINYYSKPENQPEYSIAFMAFGAEEAGLLGSEYYVKNPLFSLKKIKFLLNLDLLGTGEEGITVVNATKFPNQYDQLVKINEEKKLLTQVKKRGPAANSDHHYFTEKGVPAFFIYTMGGIAAYHDIYDKAETLPLTKFTEVFQLLTGFISGL